MNLIQDIYWFYAPQKHYVMAKKEEGTRENYQNALDNYFDNAHNVDFLWLICRA